MSSKYIPWLKLKLETNTQYSTLYCEKESSESCISIHCWDFSPLWLFIPQKCMINRHQSVDFNLITQRNNHGLSSRVSRTRVSCDSEANKSSSRKNYARILQVTQLSDFTSLLATKEIEKQQKMKLKFILFLRSRQVSERALHTSH